MRTLLVTVATIVIAVGGLATSASAGETSGGDVAGDDTHDALVVGYDSAWKLFGGISGGGSFPTENRGGFAGVQTSVVRIKHGRWMGIQSGLQYDFAAHSFMATAGPEIGYKYGGIDAGVAARFGGDETQFGPKGRLIATVGVISVTGGYGYFPDTDDHLLQFGLVLKGPLISPWGYDPF